VAGWGKGQVRPHPPENGGRRVRRKVISAQYTVFSPKGYPSPCGYFVGTVER
jgi:hypothetical protein